MYRSLFLILLISLFGGLKAQEKEAWPAKPVKIIVPFKPGGTTDSIVRVMQKAIKENKILDRSLTVINVDGHYSVGCDNARLAKPDGYTFLAMHKALMGGSATKICDFGHQDFTPVGETTSFSLVMAVHEDAKWQTLEELLADAKARPNKIIFGCNISALNHMAGISIQEGVEGAKFNFIQIGGGAANFEKINGKFTHVSVFSTTEYLSFKTNAKEKGLRALAFTGPERHSKLPEVPTLKEILKKDITFTIGSWWFAPKGTPKEAVDGFMDALEKAMETDFVKQQNENRALNPTIVRGKEFEDKLEKDWVQVQQICRSIKVSKSFDALGPLAVPKMVFFGTVILILLSIGQSVVERRHKKEEKDEDAVEPQFKMAASMLGISIGYIMVLASGYVSFIIATIIYLVLAIGLLGRFEKKVLIYGVIIALVMSFGCDYIFTEIFEIDLPSGGE